MSNPQEPLIAQAQLIAQTQLIGESAAIRNILKTIEKITQTDSTILITGESGTGKELVARAIHEKSNRSQHPFVIVNCGAIPSDLLEAELFGHVKGAFTGATQSRQGRFKIAQHGTIFLDEIGDLPLNLQVKLLRVLQTKQFESLGSSQTIKVDVRIIAATNRDLEQAIQKQEFREDLYYRLNVIPMKIPALRERKEDIPHLIQHFLTQFNEVTGHNVDLKSGNIMDALLAYHWPGNVRELKNLIERLVILKGQDSVDLADLPLRIFQEYQAQSCQATPEPQSSSEYLFPQITLPKAGINLKAVVNAFENYLVDQAILRTRGNKNKASVLLTMKRTTLVEKLRKRGMIVPLNSKKRLKPLPPSPYLESSPSI